MPDKGECWLKSRGHMSIKQTNIHQKYFIMLLLLLFSFNNLYAMSFDVTYEMFGVGEGKAGYYLVEISAYVAKKKEISREITKKCAVHGVLFKGYSGHKGYASKPALIRDSNLAEEKTSYFEALIEEKYEIYTSMANEFMKVVKVGKKYKVTTIVQVNVKQLRRDLERDKIIKTLGF